MRDEYDFSKGVTGKYAYLTPDEAAKLLRVDRHTIYEWCRSKKMKAVKVGRSWRIPSRTVTEVANAQ